MPVFTMKSEINTITYSAEDDHCMYPGKEYGDNIGVATEIHLHPDEPRISPCVVIIAGNHFLIEDLERICQESREFHDVMKRSYDENG